MSQLPRVCRECGCTDIDCTECIERTGTPCHWVDIDLCSACSPDIVHTDVIHEHFGLSFAKYLVVPRSILQSMPALWQAKFVALLEEMERTCRLHGLSIPPCSVHPLPPNAYVSATDRLMFDWLKDYERGRRNVFAEGPVRVG